MNKYLVPFPKWNPEDNELQRRTRVAYAAHLIAVLSLLREVMKEKNNPVTWRTILATVEAGRSA